MKFMIMAIVKNTQEALNQELIMNALIEVNKNEICIDTILGITLMVISGLINQRSKLNNSLL